MMAAFIDKVLLRYYTQTYLAYYQEGNMKLEDTNYSTEQIKEISEKYIMNTFQRYDFVQESGKGMYVTDTDGNEYLDFYAGIAVNSTGNQNEKVIEAIIEQTKDLIHSSNYPYSIPQALLAEKI